MANLKDEIISSAIMHQICVVNEGGCRAAFNIMQSALEQDKPETILLGDAEDTLNSSLSTYAHN